VQPHPQAASIRRISRSGSPKAVRAFSVALVTTNAASGWWLVDAREGCHRRASAIVMKPAQPLTAIF